MSEKKLETFNVDEKTSQYIEALKWKMKVPKSELIRKVFTYFGTHPEELKKILEVKK